MFLMVGVEGLVTSTSQRIADYSQISYQVYCLNIAHACIIFVIGDTILADRGFNIQESVGLFCATVKIPAFVRGKKQLSGIEVEQTRSLANVRIHVERVIGNIRKKFSLLSNTQPIDYLVSKGNLPTVLDMAVHVSCCLNNLCDSVIKTD